MIRDSFIRRTQWRHQARDWLRLFKLPDSSEQHITKANKTVALKASDETAMVCSGKDVPVHVCQVSKFVKTLTPQVTFLAEQPRNHELYEQSPLQTLPSIRSPHKDIQNASSPLPRVPTDHHLRSFRCRKGNTHHQAPRNTFRDVRNCRIAHNTSASPGRG